MTFCLHRHHYANPLCDVPESLTYSRSTYIFRVSNVQPERIPLLVDEYVMKSELTERLVPIIERAHNLAVSSTGRTHSREAAWSLRGPRKSGPCAG